MELDPQVSPEEIMSREVELGCESWTSFASGCFSTVVQRRTDIGTVLVTLPVLRASERERERDVNVTSVCSTPVSWVTLRACVRACARRMCV